MAPGTRANRPVPQAGARAASRRPWHREPWLWVLMSGPIAVVIAGMATLWLAISSNDGLVADDYYKRGLAINQTLSRETRAAAYAYRAQLTFSPAFDRVRISLAGQVTPPALRLRLVHPTRAGLDELVDLPAAGSGVYEAKLAVPQAGTWHVIVEDDLATWRLRGNLVVPGQSSITLQAH